MGPVWTLRGEGNQGLERKSSKGRWLEKLSAGLQRAGWNVSTISLWCWFLKLVVSCITWTVSWYWFRKSIKITQRQHKQWKKFCSESDNSWVSGKSRDWKCPMFQHMVNLVFNLSTCKVKSIQCSNHSTPFFGLWPGQIQKELTHCCCATTYLVTDLHGYKPKSKSCMLVYLLKNTMQTHPLGSFIFPFKY